MNSDNWKTGLLASNLPLEYEILDILTAQGFSCYSDFKYARNDAGIISDFSVDVHASAFTPFGAEDDLTAKIDILGECEHRHPDINWLFIPNIAARTKTPEDFGQSIRIIDQFSPYTIAREPIIAFDRSLPQCQKGIEINIRTGNVTVSEFNTRLAKLQHVLPRLYTENVLYFQTIRSEWNLPFLFCPILITSAKIFMLKPNISLQHIEDAESLEDVAQETPYIIIQSDYGPDFENQCRCECERLKVLQRNDQTMLIEQQRARYFNTRDNLPFTLIDALTNADRFYLKNLFTRFIACTNNRFSELMDAIKQSVNDALDTRKTI